jgi:hypothetical protein
MEVAIMSSPEKLSRVYEELSGCYGRQKQGPVRDRLLVLAAESANTAGKPQEAERLRARLLQLSPHHLLKPFASFADAVKTRDVQTYIAGLKRTYPPDAMEGLLETARKGAPLPDLTAAPPLPAQPQQTPSLRPIELPASAPLAPLAPLPVASVPGNGRTFSTPKNDPPVPQAPLEPRNRLPEIYAVRREASVRAPSALPPGETNSLVSLWVSSVLFSLALAGGLALAAYCVARPFLPGF